MSISVAFHCICLLSLTSQHRKRKVRVPGRFGSVSRPGISEFPNAISKTVPARRQYGSARGTVSSAISDLSSLLGDLRLRGSGFEPATLGYERGRTRPARRRRCSAHEQGRSDILLAMSVVICGGWLPSKMAVVISGARKASLRMRAT